jgi:hypothetical protein
MPSMNCLSGEDGQRGPDETEGNQMIVGEGFVIEKNTEKKTPG